MDNVKVLLDLLVAGSEGNIQNGIKRTPKEPSGWSKSLQHLASNDGLSLILDDEVLSQDLGFEIQYN